MKTTQYSRVRATVLACLLATAGLACAQSTTTTYTTSAGTISEFSPDTITVRSTTDAAPVSYTYSKTTTYVDENGNPVAMETVRSGVPVTVYYSQDGDRMVASKVVVRKTLDASGAPVEVKKTTTTTTTTSGQ